MVAAFDLDGVLVDSEDLKIATWRSVVAKVLRPSPDLLADLDAFNRSHRGVPRTEKFAHAVAVAGHGPEHVDHLLAAYADELKIQSASVVACPGAVEFVGRWPGPVAVVSSAPVSEVEERLGRLGFRSIDLMYGADVTKAAGLRAVCAELGAPVLYFGDAPVDRAAAEAAGCGFVAVGPNRSAFGGGAIASAQYLLDLIERMPELAAFTDNGATK